MKSRDNDDIPGPGNSWLIRMCRVVLRVRSDPIPSTLDTQYFPFGHKIPFRHFLMIMTPDILIELSSHHMIYDTKPSTVNSVIYRQKRDTKK